jgi:HK97 family phage prohead protease
MKNKIQTRDAFVRSAEGAINEDTRTVEFVISSEAVDSYETVFKMNGWQLDRFNNNAIVCYNHDSHGSNPDTIIGTGPVFIEDGQLIGRVTFEDAETNPLAEKIFRKVKNGTLKMASVGARVIDARMGIADLGEDPDILYFTKHELLEWSVVSIGANPDANKRNKQALEELRANNTPVEAPEVETGNLSGLDVFEAQYMFNKNNN